MGSFKKLVVMFVAMVFILGGVAGAFAAWTDSVSIKGTVSTGTVELVVEDYSGTWVYKMPDHGIEVIDGFWDGVNRPEPVGDFVELVAYAEARPGDDDKSIAVEYDNLFPGIDFKANALIHYNGSVPAIVWSEWVTIEPEDSPLIPYVVDWAGLLNKDTEQYEWVHLASGVQMHYCDMLKLVMTINLPQDNTLMNQSGRFEVKINAEQWNTCIAKPPEECREETAWGGDTTGGSAAWWFYFDTDGPTTQVIWAAQTEQAGFVTIEVLQTVNGEVTIKIEFGEGWELQNVEEPVKIQGYAYADVPTSRPAPGGFTTYKGDELEVTVPLFDVYAIHLDVQFCE